MSRAEPKQVWVLDPVFDPELQDELHKFQAGEIGSGTYHYFELDDWTVKEYPLMSQRVKDAGLKECLLLIWW